MYVRIPSKAVPGALKPGDYIGISRLGVHSMAVSVPVVPIEIPLPPGVSHRSQIPWGISTVGRTKLNLLTPTDDEPSTAPATMDDGKFGRKSYQMGH